MPSPRGTSANIFAQRANIFAQILYRQKLESLAYISLMVWVYLHSNFVMGSEKTHLFCNTVCIGRSRSSKVVDFGTIRKSVCDFLFVINSNWSYRVPFLSCDLLAENCEFSYPLSFTALPRDESFWISGSTMLTPCKKHFTCMIALLQDFMTCGWNNKVDTSTNSLQPFASIRSVWL